MNASHVMTGLGFQRAFTGAALQAALRLGKASVAYYYIKCCSKLGWGLGYSMTLLP
jgi:hypothetical protein